MIINGDAYSELQKIESCSIDVLISDIPYGVHINTLWDKHLPSTDVWNEAYRVLKSGSHCILFGMPSMAMNLLSIMSETQFDYRDMLIWEYQGTHSKGTKVESEDGVFRSKIRNVINPIFVFRKKIEGSEEENWLKYKTNLFNIDANREPYAGDHSGIIKKFNETGEKHLQSETPSNTFKKLQRKGWVPDSKGREPVNIKYVPRASKFERTINGLIENTHETVKPINLMLWLVGLTTYNQKQIVLDPFCGSGSTGCACALLDRQFIGIDIDKKSCEMAEVRVSNVKLIEDYLIKHK